MGDQVKWVQKAKIVMVQMYSVSWHSDWGRGEVKFGVFCTGSMHVIEYNWGSEDAWAAGGGIKKSVCL